MSRHDRTLAALIVGTASSLFAAIIASASSLSPLIGALIFALATVLLLSYALAVRHRFQILRSIGIKDWEASMSEGTTTKNCIVSSQTSLRFMGIAASKWLAEPDILRRMLQRHASNGGHAEFLLLNPDSDECRRFEIIKNRPAGSLAAHIRQNAAALEKLQAERYRVSVRFYDGEPRFRIVILDSHRAIVGLYSFTSDSGDDTPQLIFDSEKRPWSFYYGMNAYFLNAWEHARLPQAGGITLVAGSVNLPPDS